MDFDTFKYKVEGWAEVRGIYDQSTERHQIAKALEEIGELIIAESIDDKMDAIGDIAVCVVNAAKFRDKLEPGYRTNNLHVDISMITSYIIDGLYNMAIDGLEKISTKLCVEFEQCLSMAWNEIKDRKGMMVDGLYVKWDSMTEEQKDEFMDRDINNTLVRGTL